MRPVRLASRWLLSGLALALAAPATTATGADGLRASADGVAQVDVPELGDGDRLKFEVGHGFDRSVAKVRICQLLEYWTRRFGVKSHWEGDRVKLAGHLFGVDFRARFDVGDTAVDGETTDPGTVLRSSARTYIEKKLKKYLSPNYSEP